MNWHLLLRLSVPGDTGTPVDNNLVIEYTSVWEKVGIQVGFVTWLGCVGSMCPASQNLAQGPVGRIEGK